MSFLLLRIDRVFQFYFWLHFRIIAFAYSNSINSYKWKKSYIFVNSIYYFYKTEITEITEAVERLVEGNFRCMSYECIVVRQRESKSSMLKCWALSPNWSVANKTNSGIGHGCWSGCQISASFKAGNRALKTTYLKTRKKKKKRDIKKHFLSAITYKEY